MPHCEDDLILMCKGKRSRVVGRFANRAMALSVFALLIRKPVIG